MFVGILLVLCNYVSITYLYILIVLSRVNPAAEYAKIISHLGVYTLSFSLSETSMA